MPVYPLSNDDEIGAALNVARNPDLMGDTIQAKIGGINQALTGLDLEANTPQFNTGIGGAGMPSRMLPNRPSNIQEEYTVVHPTVDNPQRIAYPGVYERPDIMAAKAAARVAPEDPALKQIFGVTRDDLYQMSKGRQGTASPDIMLGKGRTPDTVDAIMNQRNAQRLVDALGEAERYPALTKGMDAWYTMDPLYHAMVKELGPELATKRYTQMNTRKGMMSPGSDVVSEIKRGLGADYMAEQGRFPEFSELGGVGQNVRPSSFPPELLSMPGHPYHSTSHMGPMGRFNETGVLDMGSPKVPLYIQSSNAPELGQQTRWPVPDAHFARGVGMGETRTAKDFKPSMNMAEYSPFGEWYYQNVAQPLGLEGVPAQARQWGLMGHATGVETDIGAPKLELLAQHIMESAHRNNVDPITMRNAIIRGEKYNEGGRTLGNNAIDNAMRMALGGDAEIEMPHSLKELQDWKKTHPTPVSHSSMDNIFTNRVSGFEGAPPMAMPANLDELLAYLRRNHASGGRAHFEDGGDSGGGDSSGSDSSGNDNVRADSLSQNEQRSADTQAAIDKAISEAKSQQGTDVRTGDTPGGLIGDTGGSSGIKYTVADINNIAEQVGGIYGVDPKLIQAMIKNESQYNLNAIGSAGEVGLMQVKPSTYMSPGYGVTPGTDVSNLANPYDNVDFAVRYLLARAGGADLSTPEGQAKALAAYNSSSTQDARDAYVKATQNAMGQTVSPEKMLGDVTINPANSGVYAALAKGVAQADATKTGAAEAGGAGPEAWNLFTNRTTDATDTSSAIDQAKAAAVQPSILDRLNNDQISKLEDANKYVAGDRDTVAENLGVDPNDLKARIVMRDGEQKVEYYTKDLGQAIIGDAFKNIGTGISNIFQGKPGNAEPSTTDLSYLPINPSNPGLGNSSSETGGVSNYTGNTSTGVNDLIKNSDTGANAGLAVDKKSTTPDPTAATSTLTPSSASNAPYLSELSKYSLMLPSVTGQTAQQWADDNTGGDLSKIHASILYVNGAPRLNYYTQNDAGYLKKYNDVITQDYQKLFKRAPDVPGEQYWANRVGTGQVSIDDLLRIMASGAATGSDDAINAAKYLALLQNNSGLSP